MCYSRAGYRSVLNNVSHVYRCKNPLMVHLSVRHTVSAEQVISSAMYVPRRPASRGTHLPGGALHDLDAADELAFQLAALVRLRQRPLEQPR